MIILIAFFCSILSLFKFVQYEFSHNRVQYCKCDKINEQQIVLIIYIGRKCFNLLSIPTFRATCFDRLSICVVQLKCSSINIPRNLVNLTCFILFPSTCIKALFIFYCFPFGVNIITFYFLVFRENFLVWNHVEIFCISMFTSSMRVLKHV